MILYKTDFEIYSIDLGADIAHHGSRAISGEQLAGRTAAKIISPENYCFSNFANRTTLIGGAPT